MTEESWLEHSLKQPPAPAPRPRPAFTSPVLDYAWTIAPVGDAPKDRHIKLVADISAKNMQGHSIRSGTAELSNTTPLNQRVSSSPYPSVMVLKPKT